LKQVASSLAPGYQGMPYSHVDVLCLLLTLLHTYIQEQDLHATQTQGASYIYSRFEHHMR
jgi:hypothetical protein